MVEVNPRRVLVVVTRQIGDVLLTTPLIRAAKQRWPQARIDVLGFSGTLGMLVGNTDIGSLIEVPSGSGWWQSLPLIRRLWHAYDLALIAQYTDRAHLYGWIASRVRSGQVPDDSKHWWKRAMLSHIVPLGAAHSHVVLEKLRLLAPWVEKLPDPVICPPPPASLPDSLATVLLTDRYLVIHAPSLVTYKQWPIDHYAKLVRELALRGWQCVLTGGPSNDDRHTVKEVVRRAGATSIIDAAGQLSFNQLTKLIRGARAYIGPDTSVTHLAAACGVPVIALFGPIDPRLWGPWPVGWEAQQPYVAHALCQRRNNITLLQGGQACVPCNSAGCERHPGSRSECLDEISPARALDEVLRVLEGERNVDLTAESLKG